mgnify:CR=1 FL=1
MKKLIIFLVLLSVVATYLVKTKRKENETVPEAEEKIVSLIAFGDNLIHNTIYTSARTGSGYDFKPILLDVKEYIQNFDIRFINQETILGGTELGLSTYPAFNTPQEMGDALLDAGFNLISLANNHTLDRGERAVINSVNYWNSQDVIHSGSVLDPDESQVKIFEKKGIKFAFVAYTYGTNGIPHPDGKTYLANVYSDAKASRDLKYVRDIVDVIIVSMHWGEEYRDYPNEEQIRQARHLSSLGVDIIIGHHPHVIQPVELLENEDGRKTFVMYSLGNFLSDQKGIDRLIGMGVSLDIRKNSEGNVSLENFAAKLLYRYKNYNDNSFRILFFDDLSESFLKDYARYFSEKEALIKTYFQNITVS